MNIAQAQFKDIDHVLEITQNTIQEIYPHYYPLGAVDFFRNHHCRKNIEEDIRRNCVWIVYDSTAVGTVSVKENEISRLFVLPAHQGKGYGCKLMNFAETIVFQNYRKIVLNASFPAQKLYHKRGYRVEDFCTILCGNGDYLCYNYMTLQKNDCCD